MLSRSPHEADEDLVRQCLDGSREAFGLLVVRHSRAVRAICMARIGHREADDAVQEVFLRAYRGLRRLNDASRFRAFVGQIARNHCTDRLRVAKSAAARPISLDEIELEPEDPTGSTDDFQDLRLQSLRREVGRLPESQREVLLLFYFQQMSYAAMADTLGITEAAVNQRLSRARQQLRTVLAGGGDEPGARGSAQGGSAGG